ncbi:hypothetical protein L7F22_042560 [Adiantum nelumboides]|nr:hypothetical protein [Adiantum nelumboides]
MQQEQRPPRPSFCPTNRPILCYRCGEYGHYQSKCPLPEGSPRHHCPDSKDHYSKDCPKQRASSSSGSTQNQQEFTFPKINLITMNTIPQPSPATHVVNPQQVGEPNGVLTRAQRAALGLSLPTNPSPPSSLPHTDSTDEPFIGARTKPNSMLSDIDGAFLEAVAELQQAEQAVPSHTEEKMSATEDYASSVSKIKAIGLGEPITHHRRGKKSPLQEFANIPTLPLTSPGPSAMPIQKHSAVSEDLPFEELPPRWLQEKYAEFPIDQTPAHDISTLEAAHYLSTNAHSPATPPDPVKEANLGSPNKPQHILLATWLWEHPVLLNQVISFMHSFKDVLAWSYKDLEGIPQELGVHTIPLIEGAKPVRGRAYKLNPKYAEAVKLELKKMQEAGIIVPVEHSEWLPPMVIAPRNNPGKNHVMADHLSRVQTSEAATGIEDDFPDSSLFKIDTTPEWPFTLIGGQLYKSGPDGVLRRCVSPHEIEHILEDAHYGPAGGHYPGHITAQKIIQSGLWWPYIFRDAIAYVKVCDVCQRCGPKSSKQANRPLQVSMAWLPFERWGIDFVGPISPPAQPSNKKYLLVATDYATKWAETQQIPQPTFIPQVQSSHPTYLHHMQSTQSDTCVGFAGAHRHGCVTRRPEYDSPEMIPSAVQQVAVPFTGTQFVATTSQPSSMKDLIAPLPDADQEMGAAIATTLSLG